MADIIKRHSDDVIFSLESLQEFIRLIQRQGINNLTIYSVNELLANDKYKSIKTRMPPPTFPNSPQEFSEAELKGRRNYFVFVRYSFPWQQGGDTVNGIYISNNEKNGRHVFIQTVNDIKFYKTVNTNGTINTNNSSVFSQDALNDASVIKENTILTGNTNYYTKNGTFVVTIDNTQYVIKIRGFNDDGKYTGAFAPNQGTDKFLRGDGSWTNKLNGTFLPGTTNACDLGSTSLKWKNLYLSGTLNVDGQSNLSTTVPRTSGAYNLGSTSNYWNNIYITGSILPQTDPTNNNKVSDSNLGTDSQRWSKLYAKDGDFSGSVNISGNLTVNGHKLEISRIPTTTSTSAYFWRGDGSWNNYLEGPFKSKTATFLGAGTDTDAKEDSYNANIPLTTGNSSGLHLEIDNNEILAKSNASTMSTLYLNGSQAYKQTVNNTVLSVFKADRVYNAVFNDYAECRQTINLEAGRVVQDNDDGSLSCSSQRLIPGCHIISDTYGHLMGETKECKTPIAVAGRVLVYTYQNRENYHAGMSVCAAPNGTVDIMTREEIINYPDCIVGTVSEIPDYEVWGTDNIQINGRIWIYIK